MGVRRRWKRARTVGVAAFVLALWVALGFPGMPTKSPQGGAEDGGGGSKTEASAHASAGDSGSGVDADAPSSPDAILTDAASPQGTEVRKQDRRSQVALATPQRITQTTRSLGLGRKDGLEMLALKGCPRCGGDLHSNRDIYGEYRECLQCGMMQDIPKRSRLFTQVIKDSKKKKAA